MTTCSVSKCPEMDDDGRWFACARSLDRLVTWLAQCVARRSGKDCRCCSPTSTSSNPPKRIFTTSLDQSRHRPLCGRVPSPCGQQARFAHLVPYALRRGPIPTPIMWNSCYLSGWVLLSGSAQLLCNQTSLKGLASRSSNAARGESHEHHCGSERPA